MIFQINLSFARPFADALKEETYGMRFNHFALWLAFGAAASPGTVLAQATDTPKAKVNSVIDEDPLTSARAAGMGGAISPIADDLDAAFHNPAGIGGLGPAKGKSWVRKLYFPEVSLSANQSSMKLLREIRSEHAATDSTIGKAIVDAHEGERQYARANAATGLVFGRTMLVPFTDMQIATTARGQGTELMDTHYRSMSGIGAGFSAQDSQGRLSLGYFGYAASRSETVGALEYADVVDKEQRTQALNDNSAKYSGVGHNVGLTWRLGKAANPTIAVALKNAGDTKFRGSDGTLTVKQDATVGFALSPSVGKTGQFNFVVEAGELTDDTLSFAKKYRIGTELLLGGIGSYATFGVRAGYNDAGGSAGLSLNLGLVGLEASLQSVDIAADNTREVERRGTVTLYVNVADF